MIVQADAIANAREVFKKKRGWKALAEALGVEVVFDDLFAYVQSHSKSPYADFTDSSGEGAVKLMYATLMSDVEQPHAMEVFYGHTILVARDGDHLVLGIQDGSDSTPFKKWGWKISPRWYKDPAKNGKTIKNWLADPARAKDTIRIAIVRELERPKSDDRGAPLLEAVCADPDDIAARLVYSDWLIEQGDMRGELIRVQCDLATKPSAELEARSEKLLKAYGAAIKAPIDRWVDRSVIQRGLIQRVDVFSDMWIKHGAKIQAAHPIRELELMVKDAEDFAKIGAMPTMNRIRVLHVQGRNEKRVTNSGAKIKPSAVAKSAMFSKLEILNFTYVEDTNAEWAKFFDAIEAPNLVELHVREALDDKALTAIARSKGMPKLGLLDIWSTKLGDIGDAMKALAKRASLHTVDLGGARNDAVLAKNVKALLASPTITKLILNFTNAGPLTAKAIAASGKHLTRLSFERCKTLDVGVIAEMLESKHLAKLERLYVSESPSTEDSREAFTVAVCNAPKALKELVWYAGWGSGDSIANEDQAKRIQKSGRRYDWAPPKK